MTVGQKLYAWFFAYQGSTRPAGLIRIGLAILLLYRFYLGRGLPHNNHILIALFLLACGSMLIGAFSQISTFLAGILAFGSYYYYGAWELGSHKASFAIWHHHTYILSFATVLLSLVPCGRSYAVDRYFAARAARKVGAPEPLEEGDLFGMRVIAVQMAVLYFFAFWDKTILQHTNDLFTAFLDGDRLQAIILFHYWGSAFELQPWMSYIASTLSLIVVVLELVLPLLLIDRLQKFLIPFGVILHVSFYVLLSLQTYSLTCLLLYLAIIDANKTHAFIDALGWKWRDKLEPAAL